MIMCMIVCRKREFKLITRLYYVCIMYTYFVHYYVYVYIISIHLFCWERKNWGHYDISAPPCSVPPALLHCRYNVFACKQPWHGMASSFSLQFLTTLFSLTHMRLLILTFFFHYIMCIGSERCAWRWGAGCAPFFFVCVWGLLCWHRKPSNKWHHMEASLWWDMARISFGSIRQWQNPHRLSWYVLWFLYTYTTLTLFRKHEKSWTLCVIILCVCVCVCDHHHHHHHVYTLSEKHVLFQIVQEMPNIFVFTFSQDFQMNLTIDRVI